MKESNYVRKLLIASAIFVLGVPAIASAVPHSDESERASVRVSYADLNLSSEAGLLTLYSRLRAASHTVCGSRSLLGVGSLAQLAKIKSCYRNALSKAVAKFNNAELNEIHAG